jgi:hypothetical protein
MFKYILNIKIKLGLALDNVDQNKRGMKFINLKRYYDE